MIFEKKSMFFFFSWNGIDNDTNYENVKCLQNEERHRVPLGPAGGLRDQRLSVAGRLPLAARRPAPLAAPCTRSRRHGGACRTGTHPANVSTSFLKDFLIF